MPRSLWSILVFVSAILVWNSYPQTPGTWRSVSVGLRIAGVLGLFVLAYSYRGGTDHDPRWLSTSWWGILGLIGWSYLVVSGAYLILRRNLAALVACLALFVALYLGDRAGALPAIDSIKPYLWLGGHIGGHASITIAGVIVALVVGGMTEATTPRRQVLWILATGVLLAAGGYFLRPLYGISKNMATPAWSLYSAAICCGVYALLFWLVDLRGRKGWTRFFAPAGTNPLLAYILPDIVYGLLVLFGLQWYWEVPGEGLAGVARSVLFASAIVAAAGVLNRLGIRLHL